MPRRRPSDRSSITVSVLMREDRVVTDTIHDDELDTSEVVVRSLLREQCPQLADFPITPLVNSGTSNALWRVSGIGAAGPVDRVVRLPRTSGAASSMLNELALLPALATTTLAGLVELPALLHRGEPTDSFPHRWAVTSWIDGEDAWTARTDLDHTQHELALDLAAAVTAIASLEGLPAPIRRPGDRGGPLLPLLDRLDRWLADPQWSADDLIDTAAVRRCAAESAEVADEPGEIGFVHGDLIPGNILTVEGRLSAIIDWGGAGHGDLSQDLTPAWAILDADSRSFFRRWLEVGDAAWLRARAFALEQAVGGVLYYVPRGHQLGDVMARTLARTLADVQ